MFLSVMTTAPPLPPTLPRALLAQEEEVEMGRRALRSSSALLNTPASQTDRYHDLTRLEPLSVARSRPVARRHYEPQWVANRALEPELLSLMTADREPEHLNTRVDGAADQRGRACTAATSWGAAQEWARSSGLGLRCAYDLGEQCPFEDLASMFDTRPAR